LRRDKSGLGNLILITQLGFHVVTPTFLCVLAGIGLEQRFGLRLILPLLLLGILSGGLNAYRLAKRTIDREREQEEQEKRAREEDWKRRYGTGDGKGRNKRKGW
jgi:hypothetical protein